MKDRVISRDQNDIWSACRKSAAGNYVSGPSFDQNYAALYVGDDDILEAFSAEIAKESVVAQRSDVEICEPIAIVVGGGDAGAIEADLEAKSLGDVFEVTRAVVLVGG